MENPFESQLTAPDAVLTSAIIFKNEIAKLLDVEIMERIDLKTLINDTQKLFELYSSNDGRFLDITKRIRGDELCRFSSEKPNLVFDDSELKEWLRSGDNALFTVIVGALAEKIYKSFAEKLGEKAILENIDQSKDPEAIRSVIKSAKDNFIFMLENILKQRFRIAILTAIGIAKERAEAKKVTAYLN